MPTLNYPVEIVLRLTAVQARDIDAWRFANCQANRSVAIRRLIALALQAGDKPE